MYSFCDYDAAAATYEYNSDADAAAFGGDKRWAQGAIVPLKPRSLAQPPGLTARALWAY